MDNGVARKWPVPISFVSNYIIKEYRKLGELRTQVLEASSWIMSNQELIKSGDEEALREYKEKEAFIMSNDDFPSKQYELINQILVDNGIVDREINTYEFWDRKVDVTDAIEFLNAAVLKDSSKSNSGKAKK